MARYIAEQHLFPFIAELAPVQFRGAVRHDAHVKAWHEFNASAAAVEKAELKAKRQAEKAAGKIETVEEFAARFEREQAKRDRRAEKSARQMERASTFVSVERVELMDRNSESARANEAAWIARILAPVAGERALFQLAA